MDTLDFLAAVLPSVGNYCVHVVDGKVRKDIFVQDLPNLVATARAHDARGVGTWISVGGFDDEGHRRINNSVAVRSLFFDLDCGVDAKGKPRAFPNKRAAVEALNGFLDDTGISELGKPYLVDSGGGVHGWLALDADATVDEWRPVAQALKTKALNWGLAVDKAVATSTAQLLRLPETHNHKYAPPRKAVIKQEGTPFNLDAIRALLGNMVLPPRTSHSTALAIPGAPLARPMSAVATALAGNTLTYFKGILVKTMAGNGCGQLAHYIENAAQDGMEPNWRGVLSWAKVCADGEKAALRMSALHPYDVERMHRKLSEITGPYSCVAMDALEPNICPSCPLWGKVTNPLVLGREVDAVTETTVIEPEADEEGNQPPSYTLPTPPRGFKFGKNGGVFYHKVGEKKDEEDRDILITTYHLYMARSMRDGTEYRSEFVAIKGDKRVSFAVPNSCMANQNEMLKVLSSNNIAAASGRGGDAYLCAYVRACMTEASNLENTVNIPPTFGWQEDESFVVGDQVFSAQGPQYDYQYDSSRLHNMIRATRASGTIEDWAEVFHMMARKELWGHLAVAGAGFGSILMHFMPKGSRAATIHVCSVGSSVGKTLALSLGSSIWGEPTGYCVAATTSETTLMQRAGHFGSLPLNIDEVTDKTRSSDREWLPKYLFAYAIGSHKIKGSATGNLEISHHMVWEAISTVTSNTPMLEAMMGARKHTSEGEAKRFIEWVIPRNWELSWSASEQDILNNLCDNFGVAGRALAKWCVRNIDTTRRVCAEVLRRWIEFSGAVAAERFISATSAAIIAGYILAGPNYANILSIPVSPIRQFFLERVQESRAIVASNQTSALDLLNAYIREHNGNMVRVESNTVLQGLGAGGAVNMNAMRIAVRGRIEHDMPTGYTSLYIEDKLLRSHCADHNRGFTDFLKELEATATVTYVRKDLLSGTKGVAMRVKCIKITQQMKAPPIGKPTPPVASV